MELSTLSLLCPALLLDISRVSQPDANAIIGRYCQEKNSELYESKWKHRKKLIDKYEMLLRSFYP